jgi:hypothetical protein
MRRPADVTSVRLLLRPASILAVVETCRKRPWRARRLVRKGNLPDQPRPGLNRASILSISNILSTRKRIGPASQRSASQQLSSKASAENRSGSEALSEESAKPAKPASQPSPFARSTTDRGYPILQAGHFSPKVGDHSGQHQDSSLSNSGGVSKQARIWFWPTRWVAPIADRFSAAFKRVGDHRGKHQTVVLADSPTC